MNVVEEEDDDNNKTTTTKMFFEDDDNEARVRALNKSAAFHIFTDLCQVRNYFKVKAHYLRGFNYIYFETLLLEVRELNEDDTDLVEFVLPIDEIDPNFDVNFVHLAVAELNKVHNKSESNLISKIKLGIVSSDCTTLYYNFTMGLDCPFNKEQLSKLKEEEEELVV